MSSLLVEVCQIQEIAAHDNADKIERARVKNWWCVVGKGQYKVGDKVVYVPPDSVISEELANRWGIAKYCAQMPKDISGSRPSSLRVRAARFRGSPSFGTIQNLDDQNWEVGLDVKDYYGITKYEPPVKNCADVISQHPNFHCYTGIENIGNFLDVLQNDEPVIVTEKIHGTNSRLAWIFTGKNEHDEESWEFMAGSNKNQRKEYDEKGNRSLYWSPLKEDGKDDKIRQMLIQIMMREKAISAVIVFGEIFGPKVQDMTYGQKQVKFRAFDISVDGRYLNYDKVIQYTSDNEVEMVPILYEGPYSLKKMDELVDGPTTICSPSEIKEPFKGREGIVIRPKEERFDRVLNGRTLLKYISVDYHDRKNVDKTEDH